MNLLGISVVVALAQSELDQAMQRFLDPATRMAATAELCALPGPGVVEALRVQVLERPGDDPGGLRSQAYLVIAEAFLADGQTGFELLVAGLNDRASPEPSFRALGWCSGARAEVARPAVHAAVVELFDMVEAKNYADFGSVVCLSSGLRSLIALDGIDDVLAVRCHAAALEPGASRGIRSPALKALVRRAATVEEAVALLREPTDPTGRHLAIASVTELLPLKDEVDRALAREFVLEGLRPGEAEEVVETALACLTFVAEDLFEERDGRRCLRSDVRAALVEAGQAAPSEELRSKIAKGLAGFENFAER